MKHPIAIIVFALSLLAAYFFVRQTAEQLPALVAVHFDAGGGANSFMAKAQYLKFMSLLAVGVPLMIVILTGALYSRARDFKVPNRDYWMAPERAAGTRSFLIGHSIWLGSLLCAMLCFGHQLVLSANRQLPSLSNGLAFGALLLLLAVTLGWGLVLVAAFRRPR